MRVAAGVFRAVEACRLSVAHQVRRIRPRSTLSPGSSYIWCRFHCRLFCDFLEFSVRDAVRVDRFNVYQKLKLAKSKLKLAKSNPSRLDWWSAHFPIRGYSLSLVYLERPYRKGPNLGIGSEVFPMCWPGEGGYIA